MFLQEEDAAEASTFLITDSNGSSVAMPEQGAKGGSKVAAWVVNGVLAVSGDPGDGVLIVSVYIFLLFSFLEKGIKENKTNKNKKRKRLP